MKYILTQFFVTLGVIFFVLLLVAIYFFITDPLNLKPLIFGSDATGGATSNTAVDATSDTTSETQTADNDGTDEAGTGAGSGTEAGFALSDAQIQALVNLGIDPATVPSSINATQEACFVNVLGEDRVVEIKAGAVPNAVEFLRAKSCI